jgi:hypothetical protein
LGAEARAVELDEICSLREPLNTLPLVKEVKGTILVSSIRGLRDEGHYDAYLRNLSPRDREAVQLMVAGEWVSIDLALAHYRACEALSLAPGEIFRLGVMTSRRLTSNFYGTVAKIARASGVTPWSGLAQTPRIFEANCRGGGGTRVVKLGPKEARLEFVAFPLMGIPWCRHGWRGTVTASTEQFCHKCYVTEIESSATSVAYRVSWV